MRYPAEHKEETRERIVHAASRRFRRSGANVGIAELMKTLKLTHGGFYRHFKSKDALLAEAVEKAFSEMRAKVRAAIANAAPGQELRIIIENYLSEAHCADPAGGCPIATLSQEMARHSPAVRKTFDRAIQNSTTALSQYMSGASEEERKRKAGVLMAGMAGTLALARAISDERQRREILAAARRVYTETFAHDR
jgi:TetR/AcrR family transcriptional repressor of nem operon